MNKATVNIRVQALNEQKFSFLLGEYLGVGLLGSMVSMSLIYEKGPNVSKVLAIFCLCTSKSMKVSAALHPLPVLGIDRCRVQPSNRCIKYLFFHCGNSTSLVNNCCDATHLFSSLFAAWVLFMW